jgi:hypothetical protein
VGYVDAEGMRYWHGEPFEMIDVLVARLREERTSPEPPLTKTAEEATQ